MTDIEKAIKLLKTINHNLKVEHVIKDMNDEVTKEDRKEYREEFMLINIAISALEKQSDKNCSRCVDRNRCAIHDNFNINYCSDWSVEK